MTYSNKYLLTALLLMLCSLSYAQFSITGSNPASVKWNKMETQNFKLVYPESLDSLARVYGSELEKARVRNSWSSGLTIGQSYCGKMPVVLHPFHSTANASVTWAPKRMDIFTVPDAYSPTPIPWPVELAIHEGRHAAQMQFGASGIFRPVHYLVGEMFAGALAGVYPGPVLLEGDAVVAETALSRSGRGRQASFLNYMMPAFDCGDWRDYWQWVYGSQKIYAPDHYRTGYMLVAGSRVFFNEPLFTKKYFDRAMQKGGLFNLQKTVKETSGMKFKDAFHFIQKGFYGMWFAESLLRGPFIPSVQITGTPGRHTEYSGATASNDSGIYSIKGGLVDSKSLVRLTPDGKEERIRSFSSGTSRLFHDSTKDRIYWTEIVPHWRWSLKSSSIIRFADTSDPGKIRNLTTKGKHFNPAPSPDGNLVSVTEYPSSGGSRLSLVRTSDGTAGTSFIAPDSLQFIESAWLPSNSTETDGFLSGHRLFVTGLSDSGIGIYEIKGQTQNGKAVLSSVLRAQPVDLGNLGLWSEEGMLSFVCDRTGVREFYTLDADSGKVFQMTSTRYGINDPFLNPASDTLFYSSVASSDDPSTYRYGSMLYATAVSDLTRKPVDFSHLHSYMVADALSEQEKFLAQNDTSLTSTETVFSEPERYSKIRFPHIHSWAPVYFNYNNVDAISVDEYYRTASLGATALFQNLFGDGYGFVGYSFHEDISAENKWRHSGHINYCYSGFLPVLEFSADFNDRARYKLLRTRKEVDGEASFFTSGEVQDAPLLNVSLKAYIPINLNSGGLSRGIIPQIKYSFTNDLYSDALAFETSTTPEMEDGQMQFPGYNTTVELKGNNEYSCLRTLNFSLRGYTMRYAAPSQIYPSLGFGAEFGYQTTPGHREAFKDAAYLYTYGYLPGLIPQHGIKLTAMFESSFGDRSKYSYPQGTGSTLPRGFVNTNINRLLNFCSSDKFRATIDYAAPVFPVDWSFLGPFAYIKNFEIIHFCDIAAHRFVSNEDVKILPNSSDEILMSAGFDFNVHLGNLLWLPYDTKIGIRYARNYWNKVIGFEGLQARGLNKNYFGFTYTVDM